MSFEMMYNSWCMMHDVRCKRSARTPLHKNFEGLQSYLIISLGTPGEGIKFKTLIDSLDQWNFLHSIMISFCPVQHVAMGDACLWCVCTGVRTIEHFEGDWGKCNVLNSGTVGQSTAYPSHVVFSHVRWPHANLSNLISLMVACTLQAAGCPTSNCNVMTDAMNKGNGKHSETM